MSARRTRKPAKVREQPQGGQTDWTYLRNMTEEEIEAQVPGEYKDLPEDFWDEAVLVLPGPKQAISLRVDMDVLAWFKSLGPRYQTRMNAVLWSYMTRMKKRRKPAGRRDGPRSRRERQ